MNTNIALTKKQYEVLMHALQIAGSMYDIICDMVDKKYKKQAGEIDELESCLLESAKELGLGVMIEIFQKKKVLDEGYLKKAMDDLFEYGEFVFWDTLPRKLADRDLIRKLGKEKLRTMDTTAYIHAEYPIEDAYRNEFDTHELERLEIKK